ncbi:MAG: tRNA (adenosine(37)-N6)-threonylcarbamoyltransferase complex dimerization subunit type 1 TsaB [Clostridiales bacterium]|nr:tRNA (adenosine(37)-N6)-threonylcarbamoyltransferase complex dimerization subunit type 1 TsaB [Clostridiales bacterium]
MVILAMDSSAKTASCALASADDDGVKLLGLSTVDGILTHSETLLPMVEQLLANTSLGFDDVDLFAVSSGPGSFTGVRIGVATLKGMAFCTNKPCVGVSTLAALSRNLEGFDGLVVPVMDARRNQVYTAIFAGGKRLCDDMLITLDELKAKLDEVSDGRDIYFCGDGYSLTRKYFMNYDKISDTPALLRPQNAFSVAAEAFAVYQAAEDKSVFTDRALSPGYLRASQAERERAERLKNEQ